MDGKRQPGVRPPASTQGIDQEQAREAPPFTCRRCGAPVYLETIASGKKRYVDADSLQPHAWHCTARDDIR